jgi:hypothetical protein
MKDVVHSFSTNPVGNENEAKSVEGQSNRDNLHVRRWYSFYGYCLASEESQLLMKIDVQAGTGQNQPCRTMLTSRYLPQSM